MINIPYRLNMRLVLIQRRLSIVVVDGIYSATNPPPDILTDQYNPATMGN